MKKIKRDAIIGCVAVLVSSTALFVTGWLTMIGLQNQAPNDVLSFFFRLFLGTTPVMTVITLITVARLKVKEE